MFWEILILIAAVVVLIFAALLVYISRKLFALACERENKLTVGDGFEKQIEEYKDVWQGGADLYKTLDKEDVWIKSEEGIDLHGEIIRNGASKKVIIEAHGFRSKPQHDFIAAMPYFYKQGFNFLLIDHRAHGKSGGEYITYGVYERYDLRRWVDFVIEKFGDDVEILLHGISMGASTVLMASALDMPNNVKAIIADCGFTSPHDIFVRVLDYSFHAKPFPLLNLASERAKRKANFDFKGASTLDAMAKNTIPVLFVHGEDDDFVPIEMTEANYEVCKAEKSFVRIKGAMHACSYLIEKETCEKAMDIFLAKHFENE
ncbi:MAG: alpha/beta hydrolase [Clostridia bacterium]|nr:alpha/beta hydrolase [Clostridia bacterium]